MFPFLLIALEFKDATMEHLQIGESQLPNLHQFLMHDPTNSLKTVQ
jgi:hypothetical protein